MSGNRADSNPGAQANSAASTNPPSATADEQAIEMKKKKIQDDKVNEYHQAQLERLKDKNFTDYNNSMREYLERQYAAAGVKSLPVFPYTKDVDDKLVENLPDGEEIKASADTMLRVGTYRLSGGDHEFKVALNPQGDGVIIRPIPPATLANFKEVMSAAMDLFVLNSTSKMMVLGHSNPTKDFFVRIGDTPKSLFQQMVDVALTKPVLFDATELLEKAKAGGHMTLKEADAIAETIKLHNEKFRYKNEAKPDEPTAAPSSITPPSDGATLAVTTPGEQPTLAVTTPGDQPTMAETQPSAGGLQGESNKDAAELIGALGKIGVFANDSPDAIKEFQEMLESSDSQIGLDALRTLTTDVAQALYLSATVPDQKDIDAVKESMDKMIDKKLSAGPDKYSDRPDIKELLNKAVTEPKAYVEGLDLTASPQNR